MRYAGQEMVAWAGGGEGGGGGAQGVVAGEESGEVARVGGGEPAAVVEVPTADESVGETQGVVSEQRVY